VFVALPAGAHPHAQHVPLAGQVDPTAMYTGRLATAPSRIFTCSASISSTGYTRRPRLPRGQLLGHLVGDPADQIPGDPHVVDLGQVRLDLPSCQTLGVQGDDRLVEPGDPAGVLGHDLRLDRPVPVARHIQPCLTDSVRTVFAELPSR
jgi:hypothetical protein